MHYLYYVGLDVSKETFDASLVAFEDANEMAHRKFANSRKGICSCLHWVEKRHGIRLDDVIFCAEDMGSYISEMAVCASDRTLNFNFSLISPLVVLPVAKQTEWMPGVSPSMRSLTIGR